MADHSSTARTLLLHRLTLMIAVAMLLGLFATNIYRAATQDLAHDEALSYNSFLTGKITWPLTRYNAGNHVFHTCLQAISIRAFGVSEFTIRLPSVLAGGFYLLAAFVLCRRLAGRGLLFLGILGLATLHPYLLDYLSAARGYSCALAAWMWALVLAGGMMHNVNTPMRDQTSPPPQPTWGRLVAISLLLGISLASNLAFLFVLLATAGMIGVTGLLQGWSWAKLVWGLALPGPVFAAMVLILPLQLASPGHFYVGHDSLTAMLSALLQVGLWHNPVNPMADHMQHVIQLITWFALPVLLLMVLCNVLQLAWQAGRGKGPGTWTPAQYLTWLTGGTLLGVILLLLAAHHLAGMIYPVPRTALYLIPLTALCLGGLTQTLSTTRWSQVLADTHVTASSPLMLSTRHIATTGVLVILLLINVQYLRQFNTTYYRSWFYDAAIRQAITAIDTHRHAHGLSQVRVGGEYLYEPAINFYRNHLDADWLGRYERQKEGDEHPQAQDYDYVLFSIWHEQSLEELGMVTIHRDQFGTIVAARPTTSSPRPVRMLHADSLTEAGQSH